MKQLIYMLLIFIVFLLLFLLTGCSSSKQEWKVQLAEVQEIHPNTLLSFAGENVMFYDGQDFWVSEIDAEDFYMIGEAEFLPDNDFAQETFNNFKKGHRFNSGFSEAFQESQL